MDIWVLLKDEEYFGTYSTQEHRDHAAARWRVWQKGYALLCDVDGVLYVYTQERSE